MWIAGNRVPAHFPYDVQDGPFSRSVFFMFFCIAKGLGPRAFSGVFASRSAELGRSGKRYSSGLSSKHFLPEDLRNSVSVFNGAAGQFSAVFLKNMSSIPSGVLRPVLDIYGRFSGHAECHASPDKRQKTSSSHAATA